jgi:hypothetical protein
MNPRLKHDVNMGHELELARAVIGRWQGRPFGDDTDDLGSGREEVVKCESWKKARYVLCDDAFVQNNAFRVAP